MMSHKEEVSETAQPRRKNQKILITSFALLLILVSAVGVFFYLKYQEAAGGQKAEQKAILKQIGETLLLPQEEPAILTIADKNKLSNQALAGRVENGDTLFVFNGSKKLVVYRASLKKVVDILTIDAKALTK